MNLAALTLFVAGVLACSPTFRASGRCPGFTPQLADTLVAGAGIGGAVLAFNDGHEHVALGLVTTAMGVALAAALTGEQGPCAR